MHRNYMSFGSFILYLIIVLPAANSFATLRYKSRTVDTDSVSVSKGSYQESTGFSTYLPIIDNNYHRPQIAFQVIEDGGYYQYVYKVNDDGSGLRNLTINPNAIEFDWSPDGSKIAFGANWPGNWEIYVMNEDGSGVSRLTYESHQDYSPVWSPDGSRIAFASKRSGSAQIYTMAPDGTDVIAITSLPDGCNEPHWSPDSSLLAFVCGLVSHDDAEVYLSHSDGTGLIRLTQNYFYEEIEGWSPDGHKILFLSNRDHGDELYKNDAYVMEADGTDPVRLTQGGLVQAAVWSPDATKIAVSDFSGFPSLLIMNPDGTASTPVLCQSELIGTDNPAWSPDGTRIAYTPSSSTGGEPLGIYVVNINSSNCRLIVALDTYDPQWRPEK